MNYLSLSLSHPIPQVMKERLKQEMGRLVEKLREGYWVDDDETLWEKLKEIGDACKRFKQANPKYEDQNLCGRLSAEVGRGLGGLIHFSQRIPCSPPKPSFLELMLFHTRPTKSLKRN